MTKMDKETFEKEQKELLENIKNTQELEQKLKDELKELKDEYENGSFIDYLGKCYKSNTGFKYLAFPCMVNSTTIECVFIETQTIYIQNINKTHSVFKGLLQNYKEITKSSFINVMNDLHERQLKRVSCCII